MAVVPPWVKAANAAPPTTPPPMGTPTNTVPQNILGNLAGIGTIGAANGGVAVANMATGIGTAEASLVAIVQGFIAQFVKNWRHFDEKNWLEPFMAIVGAPVAFALIGHTTPDPLTAGVKTIVTSLQGVKLAKVEYHAAQATVAAGIVKPVPPEKEYANVAHPWPSPNSPGWGMTGPVNQPAIIPDPIPSPAPHVPTDPLIPGPKG